MIAESIGETKEPQVLGKPCLDCGLPKTPQTASCFHRNSHGRSSLRARCKACYEKKRKKDLLWKASGISRPPARGNSRPPAPDGYAYCKRCGDKNGPRPLALFPLRDGPNSKRRGVCSPCFDAARKATRLANKEALVALPDPIAKIDLTLAATIRLENLSAMRKEKKKKLDPITKVKRLYRRAWKSVLCLPWPLESRIRGRMTAT